MNQTPAKLLQLFATAKHKYRGELVLLSATWQRLIVSQQADSSGLQTELSTAESHEWDLSSQVELRDVLCAHWLVVVHSLKHLSLVSFGNP